jgi:hypothetical protein
MEGVGIECASPLGTVVVSGSQCAVVGVSPNQRLEPTPLARHAACGARHSSGCGRGSAAKR